MEGPEKPKNNVIDITEHLRAKREKHEAVTEDLTSYLVDAQIILDGAFGAPIGEDFPGLTADKVLLVYKEALLIALKGEGYSGALGQRALAKGLSDAELARAILAAGTGMTVESASQNVAYVEELIDRVRLVAGN